MKTILFSTSQTSNTLLDNLRSNETFEKCNFIGILDDNPDKLKKQYYGLEVLGKWSEIDKLKDKYNLTHFALGIGAVKHVLIKEAVYKYCVRLGLHPLESIHKTVCITNSAKIGSGSLFLPFSMVGVDTVIGNNCLLSSHVSILEGCTLEDNVAVHTGFVGGGCYIEKNVYIGPGSTIGSGVHIGRNTIVGAVLQSLKDLPGDSFCFGNPIKTIGQNIIYNEAPLWTNEAIK